MSIQTCQNNVSRTTRELATINKKIADETKKESYKTKKINDIIRIISKSTSSTTIQSKQREIDRLNNEIAGIQSKKADLNKQLASKTEQLHRCERDLAKEKEKERKKLDDAERKRQQEELKHHRAITQELAAQKRLREEQHSNPASLRPTIDNAKYDFFISHASEDKNDFVRPLAEALNNLGISVWYDEFQLKVGDSLRRSIDNGLLNSRFGIVVLSGAFFSKNWPQYELDGLVAKEMTGGKVVLPIWHKVSKDEVLSYSPAIADKVALNSAIMSVVEIAKELASLINE
ncbi:MAG: TIR domain-containing protein [Desulfobulbus sp.]|nr:TIR domain-containing protein [Desulfobulbus sp.]